MLLLLFYILAFTPPSQADLAEKACEKITKCAKTYEKNDCGEFSVSPEMKDRIITCSPEEQTQPKPQFFKELARACGVSMKDSTIEFFQSLPDLPRKLGEKDINDAIEIATDRCEQKLGYTVVQARNDFKLVGGETKLKSCVIAETNRIQQYKDIHWYEIKKGISDIERLSHCLKPAEVTKIVCPIIESLLISWGAGFVVARGAAVIAMSDSVQSGAQAARVAKRISEIEKQAVTAADRRSVGHQKDLVASSLSTRVNAILKKLGLDVDQMQMGMLDSDFGKPLNAWKSTILNPGKKSNEFLKVLNGTSQTRAGQAMKEIMQEGGFGNKTLLNSDLSPEQLRAAFRTNPLLRSYLHELPGMNAAIDDLNAGKITVQQFKIRIKANLFHNGPHEGFWKKFGEDIVPATLSKSDKTSQAIFKGTVFDNGTVKEGIVAPKYPGPISPEGVFHTLTDRLSQGTRGGILKILDDSSAGGRPSILEAHNLLIENPKETISQLDALAKHMDGMKNLSPSQKKEFAALIGDGKLRLKKEIEFFESAKVEVSPNGRQLTFSYMDKNGKVVNEALSQTASREEVFSKLDDLLAAEERANGDPMIGFSKYGKYFSSGRAAAGLSLEAIVIPPECQDLQKKDYVIPPPRRNL